MHIAVQFDLLPGENLDAKLAGAAALGLDGVEFPALELTENVPAIAAALERRGLRAAAINAGGSHLLHPEFAERERAIIYLRQAMADALDLGARGIVLTPHLPTTPPLPDLHPYKSALELEAELLVTQLRATLVDLAYAMGAELYLLPQDREHTHLLQRLGHAALILRKNNNHPHLKIAAGLHYVVREEDDFAAALAQHADRIGYAQTPTAGDNSLCAGICALRDTGYDGWLTLCRDNRNGGEDELPAAVDWLRSVL
jgi:sugar phosphate isomerase/epimerase